METDLNINHALTKLLSLKVVPLNMAYLIYAIDHPGKNDIRENIREQHRQHLRSVGKKLLASGALLDEDGHTVIGGISLLDTDEEV